MARILVTGDTDSLAPRMLLERLVETIRGDGHDAALTNAVDDPAAEVRDADAVVALLDGQAPGTAAVIAFAHANRKPVLACQAAGTQTPRFLRNLCTQIAEVRKGSEIPRALEQFYEKIRPFAGRLVRDNVPELVKAAGHQVKFRRIPKEDIPNFLKRKISEEAHALNEAAGGREKEELADLLEALEAFIAARGIDKDELKRIKAHKNTQRGSFTEGWVVEAATTSGGPDAEPEPAPKQAAPEKPEPPARPATRSAANYDGPVWEADDAVPVADVEDPSVEKLGSDRDVKAQLHDL